MSTYKSLGSIEAIQTRPGMYIGSVENPNHLATEVIDNMLDEVANGFASNCSVAIDEKSNMMWVSDNGRGLHVYDMELSDGSTEDSIVALCTITHTGSKFDNDDYSTLIGMHGIGLVAVNALSSYLTILIRDRDNFKHSYQYVFDNRGNERKQSVQEKHHDNDLPWATIVGFQPDPRFFHESQFIQREFIERLILAQAKFTNQVDFKFNNQEIPKLDFESYVKKILHLENDQHLFYLSHQDPKHGNIKIYLTVTDDFDTLMLGDVNLRSCEGTYLTSTENLLKNLVLEKLDKKYQGLSKAMILLGFKVYVSLTVPEPEFDSQTKTRMTLNVREALVKPLEEKLFRVISNTEIFNTIKNNIERKFKKQAVSSIANKRKISAGNKLKDCTKTPGDTIYILEGDSAAGPLKQIRDVNTEAIFPLRGKSINVITGSIQKVKNNKEIKDLLEALGPKNNRRYNKIKILADADVDGRHIAILVTTFLQEFADDYIKSGNASVILPPLYGVWDKKKFIPLYSHQEASKYGNQGYKIMRFKGLGEMDANMLKPTIRQGVEYVLQYPDTKEELDALKAIASDATLKARVINNDKCKFEVVLDEALKCLKP